MWCPKCKARSGDDWSQCGSLCPMSGSPHHIALRSDQMYCPACGGVAESESVDVGVGLLVRGNFSCECGWEIDGPDDFGFVEEGDVEFAPAEAFDA